MTIASKPMATAHQSSVPKGLRASLDGTAFPATASPVIDLLLIGLPLCAADQRFSMKSSAAQRK
jgi:hypothetical protein